MVLHSGLTPDLKNTKISAKLYVPDIRVIADFTSTAKISLLSVKPEGVMTIDFSTYFFLVNTFKQLIY